MRGALRVSIVLISTITLELYLNGIYLRSNDVKMGLSIGGSIFASPSRCSASLGKDQACRRDDVALGGGIRQLTDLPVGCDFNEKGCLIFIRSE